MRVCIIGTGQIGYDLLLKLLKYNEIQVIAFVGRRPSTKQLPNNVIYSDKSISYFIKNPNCCDMVFDCTDAFSAIENYKVFSEQKIRVIDLTPSKIGQYYVPYISLPSHTNLNMITCGAQSCIPILKYLSLYCTNILYTEVVSQIAANSAGMATRINIDNYIETTQDAIGKLTGLTNNKVILNLNPGKNISMKTTIFMKTDSIDLSGFNDAIEKIKTYIPNYSITIPVWKSPNILMTQISILGSSDTISEYHGNLDIINCVAVNACLAIARNVTY